MKNILLAVTIALTASSAYAFNTGTNNVTGTDPHFKTCSDDNPRITIGFSPEGSARALVLASIQGATKSIDMLAYSFQSTDIVAALNAASDNGVKIRIVVDDFDNQNSTSRQKIASVKAHGIDLRTNTHFHIAHDKMMIIDGIRVETGSFNFANSAENQNSENVIVLDNAPCTVNNYQAHFDSRWDISEN